MLTKLSCASRIPLKSSSDAFVPIGQFNRAASICGVMLLSPSMDCLPIRIKSGLYFAETAERILATVNGCKSSSTFTWTPNEM